MTLPRLDIKQGELLYKNRSIVNFQISSIKNRYYFNFKNLLFKGRGSFDGNNLHIKMDKIPLLKRGDFYFNLTRKKGKIISKMFSPQIQINEDKLKIFGKNIDMSISKTQIDVNKLVYNIFRISGSGNLVKKSFIGTIYKKKQPFVNITYKNRLLQLLTLNGEKIFSINKDGDIICDANYSDLFVNKTIDFHLHLDGNIKKQINIVVNNILFNQKTIDSLYGNLANSYLNLKNPNDTIEISGNIKKPFLKININNYDLSDFLDYIQQKLHLNFDNLIVKNATINFSSINNYNYAFNLLVTNGYYKGFLSGYFDDNQIKYHLESSTLTGNGIYYFDKNLLTGKIHFLNYIYKNILLNGDLSLNYRKILSLNFNNFFLSYKKIKTNVYGQLYLTKRTIQFHRFNIFNGEFNGLLDINKNNSITTQIKPSFLQPYIKNSLNLIIGFRNSNLFFNVNNKNLNGEFYFKDKKLFINNLLYKGKKYSVYLYGNGDFYNFTGYVKLLYLKNSLEGRFFLYPKNKSGTLLFDSLYFMKNQYNGGYININLQEKTFLGQIASYCQFHGNYHKKYLAGFVNFFNLPLNELISKNCTLSGEGQFKYVNKKLIFNGELTGAIEQIKNSPLNKNYLFDVIFSYNQQFSINFLHLYNNNFNFIGSGIYINKEHFNLNINNFSWNNLGYDLSLKGKFSLFEKNYSLNAKYIKGHLGKSFYIKSLNIDKRRANVFSIKNFSIGEELQCNTLNGTIKDNSFKGIISKTNFFNHNYDNLHLIGNLDKKHIFISILNNERELLRFYLYKTGNNFTIKNSIIKNTDGDITFYGNLGKELSMTFKLNNFFIQQKIKQYKIEIYPQAVINIKGFINRPEFFIKITNINGKINKMRIKKFSLWAYANKNKIEISNGDIALGDSTIHIKNPTSILLNSNLVGKEANAFNIIANINGKDLSKLFPSIVKKGKGNIFVQLNYNDLKDQPFAGVINGNFSARLFYPFNNIKFDRFTLTVAKNGQLEQEGSLYINKQLIVLSIDPKRNQLGMNFIKPTQLILPQLGFSGKIKGFLSFYFDNELNIYSQYIQISDGLLTFDPILNKGKSNSYLPINLNIKISFEHLKYSTSFFDGFIKGELLFKGNINEPSLNGTVNSYEGVLKLFGNDFNLNNALIEFGKNINLKITASQNFYWNGDYKVFLTITGTTVDPQLSFSSIPSLRETEIKNRIFKKNVLFSGIDLILAKLIQGKHQEQFVSNFSSLTHISQIKLSLKSPLLKNSEFNEISLNFSTYFNKFTLQSTFSLKKENILKFIPTFDIGFKYSKNLSINLKVGGEHEGFLLVPTLYF